MENHKHYCPGGTKRRMTLPHLTPPLRSKNLFSYCRTMFGWFGEVGGTRKNHTHRCLWSLNYLAERKVRKTTNFRVFNTSNSSPIIVFRPRNPKIFAGELKKDAHRKMDRNPRHQKLIWSHMVPFGVNSDASFEPKN